MTIVIPMAGLSSRFTKAGYTLPKYMLYIKDKSLFNLAVSSFNQYFDSYRFVFVARDVFDTPRFVEEECNLLGIKDFKVVVTEPTRGQAETVFNGVKGANIPDDESILIFNIDTFRPGFTFPKEISKWDGYLECFVGNGANWSYAKTEDGTPNTKVIETAEKREISNFCSTGIYYFRKVADFLNIYHQNEVNPIKGIKELFVAPLYNFMIANGKEIGVDIIKRDEVIFCGVPQEYEDYLKKQNLTNNNIIYKNILHPTLTNLSQFADRNAFCIDEQFYTYRQFGETISKIRTAIHTDSKFVGLVINDDLETYASIFALWLDGRCYVPLHPNWPLERCLDICDQVGLTLILDSSAETRYDKTIVLNTSTLQYDKDNLTPQQDISDDDLAYILFTSGSTGKPKGVQITRRNVAAFMDSFWKTGITITEDDRCLQCFDLSFDVSVQGYLVPLTRGACCYTVPHGQVKYVYASGLIEDHHLTFATMAPSMLRYLKPYFDELDATSLKACILTAEACPLNLMEDWYNCATNTEIYDFYGPTECTVYCTYYKLTKDGNNKTLNGIISIGKPLANCTGLILDENGNELPTGEKGELCIAGDQVTAGYWNNEEKNRTCFFTKDGKRFYHTGDLCYKDADGDIMYSGRLDHQAKIQGFRVELGEIEWHAREFLKDTNVICIAFENAESLTEIAIFIESAQFDNSDLIAYLRSKMPSYMIPTRWLYVPAFPLNANDKIDKVKLKEMI